MRCSCAAPTRGPGVKPGPCATPIFRVAHQAGNAEELARVLGAHLEGQPVGTRGFEEREPPLRALNDADLMTALHDRMATLNEVAAAADEIPADTDVAWTGRTMKAPWPKPWAACAGYSAATELLVEPLSSCCSCRRPPQGHSHTAETAGTRPPC